MLFDMIWIMGYFGYLDFGLLASDLGIKTIWIFDISWIWGKLSVKNQPKSVKTNQNQTNIVLEK